ncbi:MAG: Eco57I restriction-modification methylase domain-containing protein, partial [Caldisericia bacterium]|nr:Eco57I restriction-modification methylase domain-containing protein [Caldisericia bacterium]
EKKIFFDGDINREDKVKKLEKDLIRLIYEEKLNELNKEIREINNEIKKSWDEKTSKFIQFGVDKTEKEKFENSIKNLESKKEEIKNKIDELNNIHNELIKKEEKEYFLWDIDFADVFTEKGGFDIVIGNPPYVKQELIGPPLIKNPTREQKDEYKKKLQYMVKNLFGYQVGGRCDLYVYFYFLSLSLLNEKGTFCFINSNSWLDVDFGKYLQEFLLKNFEIKRIIDNQVKRSFKEADINTVLVLINYANYKNYLNNKVKFVMYKKPFEDAIKIENEILIEKSEELLKNDDFKVFPKTQKDLLLEGIDSEDKEEIKLMRGKYEGGKWGGKYLRAPDIFWSILEKGKGKLIKLSEITEFYGYVHDNNTGTKFSKTLFIKSIQDTDKIYLDEKSKGVIEYGVKIEGQTRIIADFLFARSFDNRHIILLNTTEKIIGKEFYKIICKKEFKKFKIEIGIFLNTTIFILQREIFAQPLGGGSLKFKMSDLNFFYIIFAKNSKKNF